MGLINPVGGDDLVAPLPAGQYCVKSTGITGGCEQPPLHDKFYFPHYTAKNI